MTTIDAIYENGIFQPTQRVELPEHTRVRLQIDPIEPTPEQSSAMDAVYEVMSRRFHSGRHDLAERHNEHQP
jgi:predicted DNA-binding antitoxin AbrB/MazE fold protein